MTYLVQSNKCRSIRNVGTFNLHLGSGITFCKTPVTFIDSIYPKNQPEKSKESINEIKLPRNPIALIWPTYTEPKDKTGRLWCLI